MIAKSVEVTKLQIGENLKHVNLVVSTVGEAELLKDYLLECKDQGKTVNVSSKPSSAVSGCAI